MSFDQIYDRNSCLSLCFKIPHFALIEHENVAQDSNHDLEMKATNEITDSNH